MVRRSLEDFCLHQGSTRKALYDQLQDLAAQGLIDNRLLSWANGLRILGNQDAHFTGMPVSAADAQDALDLAEAVFDYVYVFTGKFEDFQKRSGVSVQRQQSWPVCQALSELGELPWQVGLLWKARVGDAVGGFSVGLFGYVLGVWLFDYVGLFTGGADYHDQAKAGLAYALLAAVIATLVVPVLAVRASRLRPARSLGLLIGMLAGLAIVMHLFSVIYPMLPELPGGCTCDPLIWEIRPPSMP